MISTFAKTDSNVFHMEVDRSINGNILFSDGFSLKTADGRTVTTVTHLSALISYQADSDTSSLLSNVRGFTQISETEIVLADYFNHCLRLYNRVTRELSVYAGFCGESRSSGHTNRKRFKKPHSVIHDMMNPQMLLVSGESDCYVHHVDTSGTAPHNITTFSNCMTAARGISQDPRTGDIFFTHSNAIYNLNYTSKGYQKIDGGTTGLFGLQYNYPYAVLPIGDNKLVVADTQNDRLRILDFDREETSSICSGVAGHRDGFTGECSLSKPRSLLVVNQTLYIGEGGFIGQIKSR